MQKYDSVTVKQDKVCHNWMSEWVVYTSLNTTVYMRNMSLQVVDYSGTDNQHKQPREKWQQN